MIKLTDKEFEELNKMRVRNWEDLNAIKLLKDKIKVRQRKIESLKSNRNFGQAVNIVNKIFGIVELENEIAQIEKDVLKIKSEIRLKEKEFREGK